MKRKASISHDEAIVRRLRKNPEFAAEYFKAALEDGDEPRVLLSYLRVHDTPDAGTPEAYRANRAQDAAAVLFDRHLDRVLGD